MIIGAVIAIILAFYVFEYVLPSDEEEEGEGLQVLVFGPVWNQLSWECTSDSDFILHSTLRGLEGALLQIEIPESGTQSFYVLNAGEFQPFTVGAPADETITITRTGTVTGFITLQTMEGAEANCIQN